MNNMKTIYIVYEMYEFSNGESYHKTDLVAYEDKEQAEKYLEFIREKNELKLRASYGIEQISFIPRSSDVIIPKISEVVIPRIKGDE